MKYFIAGILAYLACVLMWQLNDRPVVYWSNTKNECVKVFTSGQECDCSTINFETDRYEIVRVR